MAPPRRNRVRLDSRFPAAIAAAHATLQHARDMALNVGEGVAEKKLEQVDNDRGYELPIDINQEKTGYQSGKIYYEPFYGLFFEYGTPRIPAAPFMRPASRAMRKEFKQQMGDNFTKFLRARGLR
jgi:HK97 gp10 family phage protein